MAGRARAIGAATLAALLAGCATPPAAPVADKFPAALRGIGTEPFWALDLDGTAARYSTPENQPGTRFVVSRSEPGGRLMLSGRIADAVFGAVVTRATCSDGMSDRVWPYRLEVTIGPHKLSGCAAPDS